MVEYLLPSVPSGVGRARELIRTDLTDWGLAHIVDDCLLIVSELVTNAVRYGGLRLRPAPGRARGRGLRGGLRPRPGRAAPAGRGHGRDLGAGGLQIVGAIADAWGVTATDNGKVVWFCVTP
ncbi:ATP-binding protein [Nonomuraea salmonea]|uniref:ATP-binding protein n=1 Tax=Nonomuraea salmonea TaxID=46181 RepID=UPI002FE9A8C2